MCKISSPSDDGKYFLLTSSCKILPCIIKKLNKRKWSACKENINISKRFYSGIKIYIIYHYILLCYYREREIQEIQESTSIFMWIFFLFLWMMKFVIILFDLVSLWWFLLLLMFLSQILFIFLFIIFFLVHLRIEGILGVIQRFSAS